MKRLLTFIVTILILSSTIVYAQDFNVWLTTEGSGMTFSTGSRYMPPPPPRHGRHHKKLKRHHPKKHKKYVKMRHKYHNDKHKHHDSHKDKKK